MRPYKVRVLIVCLALVIAFTAVFFKLENMMIQNQGASTARASSRSTKTLTITGMRGTIYDVNMTPLAYDRRSYNVTFYRDPSLSSEEDRRNYTRSILETIKLVESNGKSTITEFWLKKDEDGVWRFSTDSTSETVNATRESQWRANFYLSNTPEEELFDALLEKYLIIDVLREEIIETYGEEVEREASDEDIVAQYEDMIVKILAICPPRKVPRASIRRGAPPRTPWAMWAEFLPTTTWRNIWPRATLPTPWWAYPALKVPWKISFRPIFPIARESRWWKSTRAARLCAKFPTLRRWTAILWC